MEFAVCLPLLTILTFGIIDLGRVFAVYEGLQNAAREAATYVSTHPGQQHSTGGGSCGDPANADWRGSHEGGAGASSTFTYSTDVSTCITDPSLLPSALTPGHPVRVKASQAVRTMTPLFPGSIAISSSVCVSIAGAAPTGSACP